MLLEYLNAFFTAVAAVGASMAAFAALKQCKKMKEIAESSNKTLLFEKRFEDYSSLKKILITARTQQQSYIEWWNNIWTPLGMILSRSKFLFGDEVYNCVQDLNQAVQESRRICDKDHGNAKNLIKLSKEKSDKKLIELDNFFQKKLDEIEKVFSPYLKI